MVNEHPTLRSKPPLLQRTAINDDVLGRIYASDQDMYPAPLTYERLKSWVEGCPELCICFQSGSEEGGDLATVGAIIVLPLLKQHWEDVLVGNLKEIDIDAAIMFAGHGKADVGLHVFHIERFNASPRTRLPYFAEHAMENIRDIVRRKDWNIIGYSALTATAAGRGVFRRIGFEPTGYEEAFVTNVGATGDQTVDMVYVYPGGGAEDTQGGIHSRSEMVVRYQNGTFYSG